MVHYEDKVNALFSLLMEGLVRLKPENPAIYIKEVVEKIWEKLKVIKTDQEHRKLIEEYNIYSNWPNEDQDNMNALKYGASIKNLLTKNVSDQRRKSISSESIDIKLLAQSYTKVTEKDQALRERISNVFKNNLLFKNMNAKQIHVIIDAMKQVFIKKDTYVIKQGDLGDYFYVIESGTYQSLVDGLFVCEYKDSGYFGELALVYNTPRAASIICKSDGILWTIDRSTYRKILGAFTIRNHVLYGIYLRKIPIFSMISEQEISKIAKTMTSVSFKNREVIIRQGEKGEQVYILISGRARGSFYNIEAQKEITIYDFEPGDFFEDHVLSDDLPYKMSVISLGDSECAVLSVAAVQRITLGHLRNQLKFKT